MADKTDASTLEAKSFEEIKKEFFSKFKSPKPSLNAFSFGANASATTSHASNIPSMAYNGNSEASAPAAPAPKTKKPYVREDFLAAVLRNAEKRLPTKELQKTCSHHKNEEAGACGFNVLYDASDDECFGCQRLAAGKERPFDVLMNKIKNTERRFYANQVARIEPRRADKTLAILEAVSEGEGICVEDEEMADAEMVDG